MGCCLSSPTDTSSPPKSNHLKHPHFQRSDLDSRAPPPVDEETVKEVLSETPKPKPPPSPPPKPKDPIFDPKPDTQLQFMRAQEPKLDPITELKRAHIQEPVFEPKVKPFEADKFEQRVPICGGEVSDASEICSLSESVSTTTVTRDEDDEVQQRLYYDRASPVKLPKNRDFGQRREPRVVGKSPTRRTAEASPGRRFGPSGNGVGSRIVQNREPGHQQQQMTRRVGSRVDTNRRDPGESSGRRSRSPAVRNTDGVGNNKVNVGRSPSARRYPGRNPVGPIEISSSSTRRVAEEPKTEEGKWPANESLDNPLVSLECFIFL